MNTLKGSGCLWVCPDIPWAAEVSCVMVWCKTARDVFPEHVGQGQFSSIGLKSLACLLSSEERNISDENTEGSLRCFTKVERAPVCQCDTEACGSRREDAICLLIEISPEISPEFLYSVQELQRTMSTPRATQTSRSMTGEL